MRENNATTPGFVQMILWKHPVLRKW